jgi:uncharacterized protein
MRRLACVLLAFSTAGHAAPCTPGAYAPGSGDFVVVAMPAAAAKLSNTADRSAQADDGNRRYLFRDGRRGDMQAADSPVHCTDDVATVGEAHWPRLTLAEVDTRFESAGTDLAGRLIMAPVRSGEKRSLVVLVHGSEANAAIGSPMSYALAAQGLDVFVYDKRGTGASRGLYTQNFELLAEDAGNALKTARALAGSRTSRAGFYGGSQGGWVAPLAATHVPADFVAVGFGLVESPIEEDRSQLLDEAQRMKLPPADLAKVRALSEATAELVLSHFERGYDKLARVRQSIGGAAWGRTIKGEYSGDILRMSEVDLRRIGRPRFDDVELIWDYDAPAVLRRLQVPLLWVLAGEDREAPIATTRTVLEGLPRDKHVDLYVFPNTDHSMVEFVQQPDGSRIYGRITDGYIKLIADWIKRDVSGPYGRSQRLR